MNPHGRRSGNKVITLEEAKAQMSSRRSFADQLIFEFSKTRPGKKLDELYSKNKTKARNAALALKMQEHYFKKGSRLSEQTLSSEFQTTPENVMRIIRIGTANRNRGDIFTEWPMTTTDDSLYIVTKTRGKSKRGATAGEILHENARTNYATEAKFDNIGTAAGGTVFTTTLSITPVVPFSVQVIVEGQLLGNDDGAGNITGTGIVAGSNSVINYTSGVISVEFSAAPTSGYSVDAEYQWDSEVSTNYDEYGTVNIAVERKRFNARPQPLGYSYTRMVELTLGTSGLGDVEDMLVRAVGDEHAMRQDYKAIQLAKRIALGNAITTFNADFAAAGEDNDYNHAQRILSAISDVSGALYNDIKRGVMNKAIAGQKALTYLKKHRLWDTDKSQPRVGGSFLAGTLDDIDVYGTASGASDGVLADNEILLTFKNPDDDGDVGLAFGVLTELVSALDFPEFYREGNIATVEDSMVINSKFPRLLRINNL